MSHSFDVFVAQTELVFQFPKSIGGTNLGLLQLANLAAQIGWSGVCPEGGQNLVELGIGELFGGLVITESFDMQRVTITFGFFGLHIHFLLEHFFDVSPLVPVEVNLLSGHGAKIAWIVFSRLARGLVASVLCGVFL